MADAVRAMMPQTDDADGHFLRFGAGVWLSVVASVVSSSLSQVIVVHGVALKCGKKCGLLAGLCCDCEIATSNKALKLSAD